MSKKPLPKIVQEPLRPIEAGERRIRMAGLYFILPCRFSEGDILTEESAAFINASLHTAVLNRFSEIRRAMLDDPRTTYQDLDEALQTFYDDFEIHPRQQAETPAEERAPKSEEDKSLDKYARPIFNKAMKGHGLDRKTYEAAFRNFVDENKDKLQAGFKRSQAATKALIASLTGDED